MINLNNRMRQSLYQISCKFLLLAVTDPVRCSHLTDPAEGYGRAPFCGEDYLNRILESLMVCFDGGT